MSNGSVVGVRDLDGRFAQMMAVKKACEAARIPYPAEVRQYFKYPEESEELLRHELEEVQLRPDSVRQWSEDVVDYIEVDLSKIDPGDIKKLRFRVSY